VCYSPKGVCCERKFADLVYGGGLGGGGGEQVGQDVVSRQTRGERSRGGVDSDELELVNGRIVAVCCRTWARLSLLTNEGESGESGSTI
jgi:hypothetical protein